MSNRDKAESILEELLDTRMTPEETGNLGLNMDPEVERLIVWAIARDLPLPTLREMLVVHDRAPEGYWDKLVETYVGITKDPYNVSPSDGNVLLAIDMCEQEFGFRGDE